MNQKKEERPIKNSPTGKAKFVHLRVPDTRFDAEGKYTLTLVLDPADPDVEQMISELDREIREKGLANAPFGDETNKDGTKTGMVEVKFSSKFPPKVFNEALKVVPTEVEIGNGSIVKVAYRENEYPAFKGGINLYLQAVQVLELVEKFSDGADFGFQPSGNAEPEEEDGDSDRLPF